MKCIQCSKPFEPSPETPDADVCSVRCFRSYVLIRSARLSLVQERKPKPITLTGSDGQAITLED